jgi:2-phospho-L-lactate guanylyltransferase|tara:strand:- start:26459 stop:27064 length:606 start_codon:yes stop_codon:yes gene_type:complete
MKFIIVPFKNYKSAKSRMRKDLSDEETEKIVENMLRHVLTEVSKSQMSDASFLITKDEEAISLAKQIGVETIEEKEQINESTSVDLATKILIRRGATSVLRIPGDLPLLTYNDIDIVFRESIETNSCILVPSKSGKGTNAILRRPPDIIKSCFGEDSLRKHKKEFDRKQVQYKIVKNKNIELDLDCLEDLQEFKNLHKKIS